MAEISTSYRIVDFATSVTNRIGDSVVKLTNKMENLERKSDVAASKGLGLKDAVVTAKNMEEAVSRVDIKINRLNSDAQKINTSIINNKSNQDKFNDSLFRGSKHAVNLLSSIRSVGFSLGAISGLKKLLESSDNQVLIEARLKIANKGEDSIEGLKNKIMRSASISRLAYSSVADTVSKLGITAGDAFSSNDEIIKFTELINKTFKIGGSSIQEQTAGMYQLTQAMASGRLQGDEFRSIIENAPLLAKAIKDYTGVSTRELKAMGSRGEITANVIKSAVFSASGDIEGKFKEIPITWGDIWTKAKNQSILVFDPMLRAISKVAQDTKMQKMASDLVSSFATIAKIGGYSFITLAKTIKFVFDSINKFKPLVIGLISLFAVYKAITMGQVIINSFLIASHTMQAGAISLLMGAQMADIAVVHGLTHAYTGLNIALLSSPIFWIPAIIIGVVVAFHYLIKAINHFSGTSISSIGIVSGLFNMFFNDVFNYFKYFYNISVSVAEFFANVWKHPLYSAKMLFVNFAISVIGIISSIASSIDKIFGSNLSGSLDGFSAKVKAWGEKNMPKDYKSFTKASYVKNADAWDRGYNFGKKYQLKGWENPKSFGGGFDYSNSTLADIANNTKGSKDNTGKMSDALTKSSEDLKLLRELAQREVIDRTLIRDVKVEMHNSFGDIRETADIDGVISRIEEKIKEEFSSGGDKIA